MSLDFSQLQKKFMSNPSIAIEESQRIICSVSKFNSYKDFYSYHLKNSHLSTCQNEWSTPQVCIYCRECSISDESCICLNCFLNGNHEGHNILVQKTTGNCDCGDPVYWKRSGFCAKHSCHITDEDHPEDYLDENLRTLLTDVIFKACFLSLKHFSIENQEKASYILDFISSFLNFGDGFRRLITISLTERIDFKDLIENITSYGSEFNESLQHFCGSLINDKLFLRNFSKISFDIILNKIIKDTPNIMINGEESVTYQVWNSFWFYAFSEKCYRYNIEKCGLDWSNFGLKAVEYWLKIFDYIGDDRYSCIPNILTSIILHLFNATTIQPNEQTQFFFDNLVVEYLSKQSLNFFTVFSESTDENHFIPIYHFEYFFCDLFDSFANKPNLKYDKLFDVFEKVDLSPIFKFDKDSFDNDRLISRFLTEKVESQILKSFHNGESVIVNCPLFSSLLTLFRIDLMSRIKIARLLSLEKYQSLRVKLGRITLNKILSYICQRLSIVPLNNKGLIRFHNLFNHPKDQSKYFTKFIPLFQMIIGLQGNNKTVDDEFCLKEYFAFELARQLGIFDDFSSEEYKDENIDEKQKQMTFAFLYISLLVVVERSLFNYNEFDFVQEQIVFALKRGVHSIEELSNLYDDDVVNSWSTMFTFNEILMKVAVTAKKDERFKQQQYKQETLFYLKEGIEWKSISAINMLNDQMTEMNNEISKDQNKLLKIPNFESEKTFFFKKTDSKNDDNVNFDSNGLNIRLKHFLMTPTVLAIVYHTLRMSSNDSGLTSSDLNDHLAMNILILVSKFIKEDEENENDTKSLSFDESTVIEYESLSDLIMKMKAALFNYHVDDHKNAIIYQTLNSKTFISLIKIKFSSNNLKKQPKCFIDLLLQRGKLGHTVLNEISQFMHVNLLEKDGNHQSNEQDIKERNHQKAKKLKENIMNHYKEIIQNYSSSKNLHPKENDLIDDADLLNSNKEDVCSICSSFIKNETLSFPLYIYRTKFPFVIDKPPLICKDSPGLSLLDNIQDFDQVENYQQENQHENENQHEEQRENEEEEEEEEEFNENNLDVNHDEIVSSILDHFPELAETEGLTDEQIAERRNTFDILYEQLAERIVKKRQRGKNCVEERLKFQRKEQNEMEIEKKNDQFKRCTIGANFVLQFSLCQHLVHPSCVHSIPFVCPVDRSVKNSLLPSLIWIQKNNILTNLNVVESINSFIENFASFFNCIQIESIEIFIELVKSISALISTYEIRLRSLPDCLDSEKTLLLSRNLFLTVWNGYRIREKPPITVDSESKLTHFQLFVKRLIELDEIDEIDFTKFVSSFIQNRKIEKEDELFIFLRRCCLAEHFLLDKKVCDDDLIDWDEILSIQCLSNRYDLKFTKSENIELKPFTFMNFPKEFLRFSESPFEFPVEKVENLYLFNISDYNYLIDHYGEIENIESEKKKNKKNLIQCDDNFFYDFVRLFYGSRHSPSLIIAIAKYASQIFLIDGNYIAFLDTFYLDKYGCTDISYLRSQLLYFNDERYERTVDLILSGDFAYSLKSLTRGIQMK